MSEISAPKLIRPETLTSNQLSFTEGLDEKAREALRKIVKRVHMRHYPTERITDYEADKMIDVMAPETVDYIMRRWGKDGSA